MWHLFFPKQAQISTKVLIVEQKIINNCPSNTLISLKSYFWMVKYFTLLRSTAGSYKYVGKLRHCKCIYWQKVKVSFSSTMLSSFVTAVTQRSAKGTIWFNWFWFCCRLKEKKLIFPWKTLFGWTSFKKIFFH